MATYKGFTYNEPGDPKPWGTVENQLDKDLIDTMVIDCITATKDTDGHKHAKVYADTSNVVLRAQAQGEATFEYDQSNYLQVQVDSGGTPTLRPKSSELVLASTLGGLPDSAVKEQLLIWGNASSPAAGNGTGIRFALKNASGSNPEVGNFNIVFTDATAASEDCDFVVSLISSGILSEKFRVKSNGDTLLQGDIYKTAFGDWTPTLATAVGSVVPTFSDTWAKYKQVGNFIWGAVIFSGDGGTDGSGTGQLRVKMPMSFEKISTGGPAVIGHGYVFFNSTYYDVIVETGADPECAFLLCCSLGKYLQAGDFVDGSRVISLSLCYDGDAEPYTP